MRPANFRVPEIMDWTVLPASIALRAWQDGDFRKELFDTPTRVLRDLVDIWPKDRTFSLVGDTDSQRHLVLPVRKPSTRDWSRERILQTLSYETEDDTSLGWCLPSEIIADALVDAEFKRALLTDPSSVLRKRGVDTKGLQFEILENSEYTYHLVLPTSPSRVDELDLQRVLELRNMTKHFTPEALALADKTGQCCASGT
jgi:hypothetical protein